MRTPVRHTLVGIIAIALATAVVVPLSPPAASAASAPALTVSGNRIVDATTGQTFVPRGANVPGLEYSCWQNWRRLPASGELAAIASWKMNTIRLPLNQSCWLGVDGLPSNRTAAQYRADVRTWVDAASAVGLAVIIDLHSSAPPGNLANGQIAMPDAQAVTFWTSVATAYSGSSNVMFDLFNEPYSRASAGFTLTWQCWRDGGCLAPVENDYTSTITGAKYTVTGMQALVNAVRSTGATQPLMLSGLNYANDLTGWLAHRPTDPLGRLIASWHNYPGQGCSTVACWNSQVAPVAASVPVVTGEFGQTDGGSGFLTTFMSWADANGIGYLPWAWWDVSVAESVSNGRYALFSGSSFTPKAPSGTAFHAHLAALSTISPHPSGSLVKLASSPTVYLVDGPSRLIPLAAFSTVSDVGLSTAYTVVTAASIAGYSIASSPLTNVLVCPTATYFAGGGSAWGVSPALVSGLPATTLAPSTCDALPTSPTSITGALFITAPTGGTIWTITSTGTKRPLLTMSTLAALSAPSAPVYLAVGTHFISSLPTGTSVIPPGRLVKAPNSPTVYLADGTDRLVPLSTFDTAADAGIPTTYFTLAPTDLTGLPVASAPLGNVLDCSGTPLFSGSGAAWPVAASLVATLPSTSLSTAACSAIPRAAGPMPSGVIVKSANSPTLFLIDGGQKRALLSMASVAALTAPGPAVYLTVGSGFLAALPTGPEVVPAAALVKSATQPTIYLAGGDGTIVPVGTFASVAELGLPTAYVTLADSTIAGLSSTGEELSNLVTCNGQPSFAAEGRRWPVDPSDVAGLPTTPLTPGVCARVMVGSPSADPLIIKSPSSDTLYLVADGARKPIGSWATVTTLSGGTNRYFVVNDRFVQRLPLGQAIP